MASDFDGSDHGRSGRQSPGDWSSRSATPEKLSPNDEESKSERTSVDKELHKNGKLVEHYNDDDDKKDERQVSRSRSKSQDKENEEVEERGRESSRSPSKKRESSGSRERKPRKENERSRSPSRKRSNSRSKRLSRTRSKSRRRSRSRSLQRRRSNSRTRRRPSNSSSSRSRPRRSRRSRSRSTTPVDGARLHVAELDVNIVKRDLERLFERYGRLLEIWMARNPPCFAFVVYHRQRDADRALRETDGTMLGHCHIKVTKAQPRLRINRFRGFDPNLRCYQCGELGHFSRNCTDTKFGYKRPPTPPVGYYSRPRYSRSYSRSRSRSKGRRKQAPSRSPDHARNQKYRPPMRSPSRSRSRGRRSRS